MVEYDTADWNKKLSLEGFSDLYRNNYEGWELDNDDKPYAVKIDILWPQDGNPQRDMEVWADDNCEGYFFQSGIKTEYGTSIVRPGDKFSLMLAFQYKADAVAFKLRWS